MLLVWESKLVPSDQQLLVRIDPLVSYWPNRYWSDGYNQCVPIEWWISFSSKKFGLLWLIDHSEFSKIIYIN